MIFHEKRLLADDSHADDSHEISYLIFLTLRQMAQNLSFIAVVIGALKVQHGVFLIFYSKKQLKEI